MAEIKKDGNFKLGVYNLPTFRTVEGVLDKKDVKIDFDKILVGVCGKVSVWVEKTSLSGKGDEKVEIRSDDYVHYKTLSPKKGEEAYFNYIVPILERLSVDIIQDKKAKEKLRESGRRSCKTSFA